MTALEKFISRRKQDRIGPDALIDPAPEFARSNYRMRKSDGRPVFRDHASNRLGSVCGRTAAA